MANHKGNRIVHNQSDTTLQAFDNSIGVFGRLGLASKVTSKSLFSLAKYTRREREEEEQEERKTYLALSKSVKGGLLDTRSVLGETHVLQHHDTAEQESSRVGETLASNVGGGTVDGLED